MAVDEGYNCKNRAIDCDCVLFFWFIQTSFDVFWNRVGGKKRKLRVR